MSYHDRSLLKGKAIMAARRKKFALMREGADSIRLFHRMPGIRIYSLSDNWKEVGEEMRDAFGNVEKTL